MERHEQTVASRKIVFFNNFLGGIAWALGATVGLSVIAVLFGIILKNINLVPYVGNFVSGVLNYVLQNNPHFVR